MKHPMPLIMLLSGAALGAAVLVASTLATSSASPASHTASSPGTAVTAPSASSAVTVSLSPSASPAATASATATATPTATASPTTAPPATKHASAPATERASAPADADYAAQVEGSGASVAVSVHGNRAVAYVCDGHRTGQWFKGTAKAGRLDLDGTDGARLTLTYRTAKAAGSVMAGGHRYTFSAPSVHGRSGLYESSAVIGGTEVKFGWIVLPNGYQVGVAESGPDSVTPAPELDVAAGTAHDGSVVLVATLISGVTGSGF